ncbi:MAG: flagellar biosynthetic protein FliP, partial [Paraclostridium bifermentans]
MQTLSDITPYLSDYTPLMKMFIVLTGLMFLGAIVFMMTSFVRIIITFSFIKSALGAQQTIP